MKERERENRGKERIQKVGKGGREVGRERRRKKERKIKKRTTTSREINAT